MISSLLARSVLSLSCVLLFLYAFLFCSHALFLGSVQKMDGTRSLGRSSSSVNRVSEGIHNTHMHGLPHRRTFSNSNTCPGTLISWCVMYHMSNKCVWIYLSGGCLLTCFYVSAHLYVIFCFYPLCVLYVCSITPSLSFLWTLTDCAVCEYGLHMTLYNVVL